jgi:hypothetical protein
VSEHLTASGMRPPGVSGTRLQASRFPSDQLTKPPRHDQSSAGYTKDQHVETNITARCRACGPITSAALLHGRCGPEVLLRGIAQGHTGCWYDTPSFSITCVKGSKELGTNNTRSLPRRSMGRWDQDLPDQARRRRLRHRRRDIRQQPPHRRPKRLIRGPLHLQRCRQRTTQDLHHTAKCTERRRLVRYKRSRHRQVHARHGDWRDEQDREYGQGQG